MKEWRDFCIFIVIAVIVIVIVTFPIAYGIGHFKAKAYNELTGGHVTTWQAMWVNLNVVQTPKETK